MNKKFQSILLLIFTTLLPSCISKKHFTIKQKSISTKDYMPLFVAMPRNQFVFENISPIVYQSLCNHFKRIGYSLVDNNNNSYNLHIKIISFSPTQKFISPDILIFHSTIKLELECKLYNLNKKLLKQKTFYFSTLISKPRNPILNNSFLNFELQKLMNKAAPRIEQYFRASLLKIDT